MSENNNQRLKVGITIGDTNGIGIEVGPVHSCDLRLQQGGQLPPQRVQRAGIPTQPH